MKFEWIGWCREGASDKVWILMMLSPVSRRGIGPHKYVTIWGRRGKRLHHRVFTDHLPNAKITDKARKGYQQIDQNHLSQVYPEFHQDLEQTALWAMLQA